MSSSNQSEDAKWSSKSWFMTLITASFPHLFVFVYVCHCVCLHLFVCVLVCVQGVSTSGVWAVFSFRPIPMQCKISPPTPLLLPKLLFPVTAGQKLAFFVCLHVSWLPTLSLCVWLQGLVCRSKWRWDVVTEPSWALMIKCNRMDLRAKGMTGGSSHMQSSQCSNFDSKLVRGIRFYACFRDIYIHTLPILRWGHGKIFKATPPALNMLDNSVSQTQMGKKPVETCRNLHWEHE